MKLIIVGLILAIAIAAISFTGGYMFSQQNTANRIILQTEHKVLAEKLEQINEKCDGIARIEALLIKAIPKSAYENDQ